MKSAVSTFPPGNLVLTYLLLLIVHFGSANHNDDGLHRSLYFGPGVHTKSGWRPVVSSGASYNFGDGSSPIAQKIMTGPATLETKVFGPQGFGVTSNIFGNGILSTSTRPIVTRDTNKITTMGQGYKNSLFPQNNINLNAPINSYFNPFAFTSNGGLNHYKMSPTFQFDSNIYMRQPISTHRPLYTKATQQMLGKRLKHNQLQMLQQLANNQYHQSILPYQKPLEYSRHPDVYLKPHENYLKPTYSSNQDLVKQNQLKHINPQGVSVVTYKPPLGSHFQQFGGKDEAFDPLSSSILGSFSSFGHASVKARDPLQTNKISTTPSIPTKTPQVTTVTYSSSSTHNNEVNIHPKDTKASSTQNLNIGVKDDFSKNLVPPPRNPQNEVYQYNFNSNNYTYLNNNGFIPSPVDPLNKFLTNNDASRFPIAKVKQENNYKYSSTKRPTATSFFDSNLLSPSTIVPFGAHTTNSVPDNLLVQLPPPHPSLQPYTGQNIKVEHNHKDKYHSYTSITHNGVTTKYGFDDIKYFPARGQNKYISKEKVPTQHSYEVTEDWEPTGDGVTQPSIHAWFSPSQSFKQYNSMFDPPKPSPNIVPTYYPTASQSSTRDPETYHDVSTVYSIVENNNQNSDQIENILPSADAHIESVKINNNEVPQLSFSTNSQIENDDANKVSTEGYIDITTPKRNLHSRRKPSKYRHQPETTTIAVGSDINEFTTRYETFKEQAQETENDLVINDLPTIPPSKHFKRPVSSTTTTSPSDTIDDDQPKKRNKNKRRKPSRPTSTTEEVIIKDITTTIEPTQRPYRYRTTLPPEIEDTTKYTRQRVRFPSHKSRATRPPVQPDLTSSAQPTMLPTHPATVRPKLHSRIRTTSSSSLDFDESFEMTTIKDNKVAESYRQSSIMKIAKDSNVNKSPNKYSSSFGNFNETPDYTHKQDEKDTPTSDIYIHTSDQKYTGQKIQNDILKTLNESSVESETQNTVPEVFFNPTVPSYPDESNIVIDQTFPETKSNNVNILSEAKNEESTQSAIENEPVTSSPSEGEKTNTVKIKPNKYGANRPRFSVKDYRNRLNQYSSTTTTESVSYSSEAPPRLRFPSRTRLSNFKEINENKLTVAESNITETTRKKFVPKDSHKANHNESKNEKTERNISRLPPTQQRTNVSSDNEVVPKPHNRFRGNLRNQQRPSTSSTTQSPVDNEKPPKENNYPNLKRPNLSTLRKRIQNKNKTIDISEMNLSETIQSSSENYMKDIENMSSTEKSTSETAIMKIAKDKHVNSDDIIDNVDIDASQRVSDLTLAASKDYNTPGLFKSVSPNSRRIVPNYFTIATDDPILPIEAFFPQLNQKKES